MIRKTKDGILLEVKVKPSSNRFAITKKGDQLIIEVTSPPKEGKANTEIVKELKRKLGKDVEIVKGFRGKDKIILIRDAKTEDIGNL